MADDTQPIWSPSPQRIAASSLTQFIQMVRSEQGITVDDYAALYQWSIDSPEQFWPAVWNFCEVRSSQPWESVLSGAAKMPGAKWFEGARLNFAQNLLRHSQGALRNKAALIFYGEERVRCELNHGELYQAVANLAAGMRAAGVVAGDRVAGFIPNRPEAVVAMLAAASIGAIWSSCSPDFGIEGAVERFEQIEPRLLFCCDGYWFKGREHDSLERAAQIGQRITSIQQTIVIPYLNQQSDISALRGAVRYADFMIEAQHLEFAQLPFDHPLYILYSSGTTGRPKCIVHGAGGTLLQHLKELTLHTDLKPSDVIFYFTTCGWMMWNWQVSALATGATLLLYDGSPFHPRPDFLFEMAAQEEVAIFGASAKYFSALEKEGVIPNHHHPLDRIRTILSTGSPLAPESYDYIYRAIGPDVQLSSISGGTDIVSCFALGNPLLPVYRGELQCRGLGMRVEVFDEDGHAVTEQKGELVCSAPAPSMPLCFWGDDDHHSKYRTAYYERFPGVWTHGDFAELTERGGLIIYGRSDALLNPGGVRIGTAEIYRQVEKLPEVVESIAIGQQWQDDVRIILFVKLQPACRLDEVLITQIKQRIRDNTTPRHVPSKVIAVDDIPRTRSGKIVELAVRNVIHNEPVVNIGAIANPAALDCFKQIPELAEA